MGGVPGAPAGGVVSITPATPPPGPPPPPPRGLGPRGPVPHARRASPRAGFGSVRQVCVVPCPAGGRLRDLGDLVGDFLRRRGTGVAAATAQDDLNLNRSALAGH